MQNDELTFESSVRGIAIYLDMFAVKLLAKGDSSLRQRFVAAINHGADLLFSIANAVELTGPQGTSSEVIKSFLNELGPNWYPVEIDMNKIMKREAAGLAPSTCCISDEFLRAFFQTRTAQDVPGSGRIINLGSDTFFQLGSFIDWLAPQRDHFREQSRNFDAEMMRKVPLLRDKYKRNPGWLDRAIPQPTFHQSRATTFAYWCLMRDLIQNRAYQIRKGDGLDFIHAVIATAFANFATLDGQWKDRVESLPKPNRNPRIYGDSQLAAMISDIEAAQAQLKRAASAVFRDSLSVPFPCR